MVYNLPGDLLGAPSSPDGAHSGRRDLGVPDILGSSAGSANARSDNGSEELDLGEHFLKCGRERVGVIEQRSLVQL